MARDKRIEQQQLSVGHDINTVVAQIQTFIYGTLSAQLLIIIDNGSELLHKSDTIGVFLAANIILLKIPNLAA